MIRAGELIDLNISADLIIDWLNTLGRCSEWEGVFENALTVAKHYSNNTKDLEEVSTLTTLYRAECSGMFSMQVPLSTLYAEIVKSHY